MILVQVPTYHNMIYRLSCIGHHTYTSVYEYILYDIWWWWMMNAWHISLYIWSINATTHYKLWKVIVCTFTCKSIIDIQWLKVQHKNWVIVFLPRRKAVNLFSVWNTICSCLWLSCNPLAFSFMSSLMQQLRYLSDLAVGMA